MIKKLLELFKKETVLVQIYNTNRKYSSFVECNGWAHALCVVGDIDYNLKFNKDFKVTVRHKAVRNESFKTLLKPETMVLSTKAVAKAEIVTTKGELHELARY